jgi:hypothetical protein
VTERQAARADLGALEPCSAPCAASQRSRSAHARSLPERRERRDGRIGHGRVERVPPREGDVAIPPRVDATTSVGADSASCAAQRLALVAAGRRRAERARHLARRARRERRTQAPRRLVGQPRRPWAVTSGARSARAVRRSSTAGLAR